MERRVEPCRLLAADHDWRGHDLTDTELDMSSDDLRDRRLLTAQEVAAMCGVVPDTVRRMSDRGSMPAPVRLGRAVRWRLGDIDEWIADSCPGMPGATA